MYSRPSSLRWMSMALIAGLLWVGASQAVAQTEIPPADDTDDVVSTDATNPPSYITEMIEAGEVTLEQAELMRGDGMGWGEIRIAVRLAEEISAASEGAVTFDQALTEVLTSLDSGLGFGEIARQHDISVGQLVGNRDQKMNAVGGKQLQTQSGNEQGETQRVTERKRGFLARLGSFLGFGKKERTRQTLSTTDVATSGKVERSQQTERVAKMERIEKMERPSRPERPERPARPERPEKPERGPNR